MKTGRANNVNRQFSRILKFLLFFLFPAGKANGNIVKTFFIKRVNNRLIFIKKHQ
jgi:hypothetical protein